MWQACNAREISVSLFCYQPVNPKPIVNKPKPTPPVPPKPSVKTPNKASPKLTPKGPKPTNLPPKPVLPRQGIDDILKQARVPSANISAEDLKKTPDKPVNTSLEQKMT